MTRCAWSASKRRARASARAGTRATLVAGRPGVLHGTRTYLLQDKDGQILETHSISAGLDYPGVGPEHSWLRRPSAPSTSPSMTCRRSRASRRCTLSEGIIPALEPSHAIYYAMQLARDDAPR